MKVNDYVRTKYGIAKIIKIDEKVNAIQIDKTLNDFTFVLNEDIAKSSPNIIDLIEVGDYVNGVEVIGKLDYLLEFDGGQDGEWYIRDDEIKSIVTKEQFERCEYRIGE